MRIAYIECFSGISGDMFLGALVDAGVSAELLQHTVDTLEIGARLEFSRVVRSGISATKADVWVDGKKDRPQEDVSPSHQHGHHHEHSHAGHEHGEQQHSDHDQSSRAGAPTPHEQ